jgi:hypothetical protein
MKKYLFLLAATLAMVGCLGQSAEARTMRKAKLYGAPAAKFDPRLIPVSLATGAAATAAYFAINDWHWSWNRSATRAAWIGSGGAYALTTGGCMAVSPMLGTVVLRRELTPREAHVLMGSCLIPIVGGYIVNAVWDANPQWEGRMP